MQYWCIKKEEWDKTLEQLLLSYTIFGSVRNEFGIDYELISPEDIPRISYNTPKPVASLKSFFLPVRENCTSEKVYKKPMIILGIPNCDIEGLCLLDEIYLDSEFCDIHYRKRRENTLLIASDCTSIQEHCHCLLYDIHPYSSVNADIAAINLDGTIVLRVITGKGEEFVRKIPAAITPENDSILSQVESAHEATEALLAAAVTGLPDVKASGKRILESGKAIWEKYSSRCVSCGACVAICPTCSCFLLIDKPGFEKVKQMDGCQYPGFERVAGGEDALFELHNRFKNRYLCKYVWKAKKFGSIACTGCGRCIEACIGHINKNEILRELDAQKVNVE
jgi:sulfhydrogenase subunit beta (sulfur reductase)